MLHGLPCLPCSPHFLVFPNCFAPSGTCARRFCFFDVGWPSGSGQRGGGGGGEGWGWFGGGGGGGSSGFHGVQRRGSVAVFALFALFAVFAVVVLFAMLGAGTAVLCVAGNGQLQLLFRGGEHFFQPNNVVLLFLFRRTVHLHVSFLLAGMDLVVLAFHAGFLQLQFAIQLHVINMPRCIFYTRSNSTELFVNELLRRCFSRFYNGDTPPCS